NPGKKPEQFLSQARGKNRSAGFKPEELMAALTEEFRVRLARDTVLGSVSEQTPAPITPYEFWLFYKENRTLDAVALLPIPVEAYLDKVTKTPSDHDLES